MLHLGKQGGKGLVNKLNHHVMSYKPQPTKRRQYGRRQQERRRDACTRWAASALEGGRHEESGEGRSWEGRPHHSCCSQPFYPECHSLHFFLFLNLTCPNSNTSADKKRHQQACGAVLWFIIILYQYSK